MQKQKNAGKRGDLSSYLDHSKIYERQIVAAQAKEIYAAIVRDILDGNLLPGDPLEEKSLARRFGVSITPVREAFLQLQSARLIERRPRAGAVIYKPPLETLVELIEVHAELEGSAAFFAARRANPTQIEALVAAEQAYADFMKISRRGSSGGYSLNLAFHLQVFEGSNNKALRDQIDRTGLRLVSFFRAQQALRGDQGRALVEHRKIVQAITDGHPSEAREAMIAHVELKGETLLDVLNLMSGD